ncbi:MAG: hypothetical protein WAV31_06265, partial [Candidatus Moraniibacteriota bacterium]
MNKELALICANEFDNRDGTISLRSVPQYSLGRVYLMDPVTDEIRDVFRKEQSSSRLFCAFPFNENELIVGSKSVANMRNVTEIKGQSVFYQQRVVFNSKLIEYNPKSKEENLLVEEKGEIFFACSFNDDIVYGRRLGLQNYEIVLFDYKSKVVKKSYIRECPFFSGIQLGEYIVAVSGAEGCFEDEDAKFVDYYGAIEKNLPTSKAEETTKTLTFV